MGSVTGGSHLYAAVDGALSRDFGGSLIDADLRKASSPALGYVFLDTAWLSRSVSQLWRKYYLNLLALLLQAAALR